MALVVAMIDGEHDVDGGQESEDEGLEERHPDTQSKEDGRHDHRYEVQHLGEDRVVAVDVAEQTQGERSGTNDEHTGRFDREDQGRERKDGAHHVLEEVHPGAAHTLKHVDAQHHDGHGRVGVDVVGGWKEILLLMLGGFVGSFAKVIDFWFNNAEDDVKLLEHADD